MIPPPKTAAAVPHSSFVLSSQSSVTCTRLYTRAEMRDRGVHRKVTRTDTHRHTQTNTDKHRQTRSPARCPRFRELPSTALRRPHPSTTNHLLLLSALINHGTQTIWDSSYGRADTRSTHHCNDAVTANSTSSDAQQDRKSRRFLLARHAHTRHHRRNPFLASSRCPLRR